MTPEEAKAALEKDSKERAEKAATEIKEVCDKYKVALVGIPGFYQDNGKWVVGVNVQIGAV